jgi:hypothetical protein
MEWWSPTVSVILRVSYYDPLKRVSVKEDFSAWGDSGKQAEERVHQLRQIYPDNHIGMTLLNPEYDTAGRAYWMPCPKPPFRRYR